MQGMALSPDERRARNAARERIRRAARRDEINAIERARRAADPERMRTAERTRYATNAERNREWQRAYRATNREKINAQVRARRAADPERFRAVANARYARDKDRINTRNKATRDRSKDRVAWLRRKHGLTLAEWSAIWDSQDGHCYLCDRELDITAQNGNPAKPVLDHDHGCCGPKKSCPSCRRGLSCSACNLIIGWAEDDPARLHRIADRLAAAPPRRPHPVAGVTSRNGVP